MGKTERSKPILITLCCSCASQFYYTNRYRMRRADRNQINKEECTYCGCRTGYDYLLYPKRIQTNRIRRIRRHFEGGTNLCCVRTEY